MTILDQIVETKRKEVAAAKANRSIAHLRRDIKTFDAPRDFCGAVGKSPTGGINLIAEVKKASPSAGIIVDQFDPVAIAQTYESAGASAISVLTDQTYFQGRLEFIAQIKRSVSLPVLRKEFILDEYQVYESRAGDADAILLISEILTSSEIKRFHATARALGMGVLIEGHSLERLLAVLELLGVPQENGYLIGVNNRDLTVQRTDVETTARIARKLPDGVPCVSESGLHSREDVEKVEKAGACAILVGESLLKSGDIEQKVRLLLGRD